jgi:hypothetical protein
MLIYVSSSTADNTAYTLWATPLPFKTSRQVGTSYMLVPLCAIVFEFLKPGGNSEQNI